MIQKGKSAQRTRAHRLISRYSTLLAPLVFVAILLTTVMVSAADSDLDPSFDGDGVVTTDHGEFEQINDIVIQSDGKIVAAGHSGIIHNFTQEPLSMMVARYNADGSPDATFGSGGIVTTDIGTYAKAWAVVIQADGKIVIAGRSGTVFQSDFTLVRYNPNGSLDTSFGTGGIVITSFGGFSQIEDVAIQSDGKIVVTGDAPSFGASTSLSIFTMARYNTDGSLDATFDGDGVSQAVPAGLPVSPAIVPQAIAVQADQKIAVAGFCFDSSLKFCVSRYNSNGLLDDTFDSDGLVMTDFDASFGGFANDLSIQPDDKIVAAGQSFSPSGIIPALTRYNPNGSLDTSFDSDGRVTMPNSVQFEPEALALQSNGKLVIVGRDFIFSGSAIAVARFNSDGSVDQTFGSGGIVTTSAGTGSSAASAVAVQTDGRIVAGGYGNFTGDLEAILSDFALVRYGLVVNHPPTATITGPASGSIFAVNTPVNFTGTFSDDPGDTHSVEWSFESVTQPGRIVVPVLATSGSADTTYTFTEPGVYKVSLKVTDNNFLSTTATTVNGLEALVVIYDADGAWVSGGGWFDSPQGAFVQMPASSGKASFGFVSQYQSGATLPIGNTRFQLNASGLNFQSTSYEWLVISGNKAQYTGVGTINGSGSYRFMLTTIDCDQTSGDGQDKVRLRIWSDSTGLIYDNQLNAPDNADPATVLGGGSIVIHR